MDTFTWIPDWGLNKRSAPNVRRVQFGDGYEQRVPGGINFNLQIWDLVFSRRSELEIDEIEAFLDAQGGVFAFGWGGTSLAYVDPGYFDSGVMDRKFVCREWQRSYDEFNSHSLRATFTEVMG